MRMQRVLDIILSFCALLILSPLLLVVYCVLKMTGEREAFFLQRRIGKDGKCFTIIKFATMLKDSPNISTGTVTIKNDPRVLPVGKFLRKYKINELPQLINVLNGTMSLIGPRPLTSQTFNYYPEEIKSIICQVKPGLSGVGSILFRDEESLMNSDIDALKYYSEIIAKEKAALEIWYVNNQSLLLYLKLIILTVIVIFFPNSNLNNHFIPNKRRD